MSSVGRNSLIMASGTAASRISGQLRTILLAAAMGTTGFAANAYQTGSMIPQVVFSVISGGIFNAVLVPQIVRTLKHSDAEDSLDRLVTASIVLLLGVTVVMMAASPWVTSLYLNPSWNMQQRALANAFTLWCMPQILFYGLYTVLGQILAAKDRFGFYAWSSVGANAISCVGFVIFIAMFGNAARQPLNFWTTGKVALTAGMWTLGVAFQAVVLFIPLLRSGWHYRVRFGVRGFGLRSMSQVAVWSIAIVVLNLLVGIVNSQITTGAPKIGGDAYGIAGNSTYQYAYSLYILPYSLIAVSVMTAVFPKLSRAISDNDLRTARNDLSSSIRSTSLSMLFFTSVLLVIPVPITIALIPSVTIHDALLIAGPLVTLSIGLVPIGAFLLIQRTFYAFEDGKRPFMFALLQNAIQVVVLLLGIRWAPPRMWTTLVGLAVSTSYVLSVPLLYALLRRRFEGHLDGRRILTMHAKAFVAAVGAGAAGWLAYRPFAVWMSAASGPVHGGVRWLQAVAICAVVTLAITATYAGLLLALRVREFSDATAAVSARLAGVRGRLRHPLTQGVSDTRQAESRTPANVARAQPSPPVAPTSRIAARSQMTDGNNESDESAAMGKPQLGDTLVNRYVLVASLRDEPGLHAWRANDHTLARDCQVFLVTDAHALAQVTAVASALVLAKSKRFTAVRQLYNVGKVVLIISALDAGVALADYLAGPAGKILSYEAMRTILGESAEAAISLRKVGFMDQAISPRTIRLSREGITIADASISAMLRNPLHDSDRPAQASAEQLATHQLAAVLYTMITRRPYRAGVTLDAAADIPQEFGIICRRALGIPNSDGSMPVPLVTLAEFQALLSPWKQASELGTDDVIWPTIQGAASIESVPVLPSKSKDILPIPDSLVTPAPGSTINAKPQWNANQLLFPGSTEVQFVQPRPNDGDLFAAFNDADASEHFDASAAAGSATGPTSPIAADQPNQRLGATADDSRPASERTSESTGPLSEQSATRERDQRILMGEERTSIMSALPPSFEPQHRPHTPHVPPQSPSPAPAHHADKESADEDSQAADGENMANARIFGHFTAKAVIITTCVVLLVAVLVWAVSWLGSSSNQGFSNGDGGAWPSIDMSDISFPGSTSAGTHSERHGSTSPQATATTSSLRSSAPTGATHADKHAERVPNPKTPENTTPLATTTQTFLNRPAGLQGLGWYVRLDQPSDVTRLVIQLRQSGGSGQVYVNSTPGRPNQGTSVANFTFDASGATTVKLHKPVHTQDIVIWVPLNSLPTGGLYFDTVQVF